MGPAPGAPAADPSCAAPVPGRLRDGILKLGLSLAGLFFPKEERQHSLGYRQLMEDPATALDGLTERAGSSPGGDFVQAARFKYLMPEGLARLKQLKGRLQVVERDRLPERYDRFYISNIIDYMEANEFDRLLQKLIASASPPWRLMFNSTYRSNMQHPHVMNVLGKRVGRINGHFSSSPFHLDKNEPHGPYHG